jgi:hypothetical protein
VVGIKRGTDVDRCGREVRGPGGELIVDGVVNSVMDDDSC